MSKVLVLGGSGLVGGAIINEISHYHQFEVYFTYYNHPGIHSDRSFKLDLTDPNNITHILNEVQPDIVISSLRGDFALQLTLHTAVGEYLKRTNGVLYYFSTTNVFDGDLSRPHYEDDVPYAQSDYGQFKITCEKKITELLHENACILRIPQVWGKDSPRLRELRDCNRNGSAITVYPRLSLNTNTDVMIAKQICHLILNDLKGTFHLVSEDIINYKDLYCQLIERFGFHNIRIEEVIDEDGCFALLSKRSKDFPEALRFHNQSVIDYLVQ